MLVLYCGGGHACNEHGPMCSPLLCISPLKGCWKTLPKVAGAQVPDHAVDVSTLVMQVFGADCNMCAGGTTNTHKIQGAKQERPCISSIHGLNNHALQLGAPLTKPTLAHVYQAKRK